MPEGLFEWMFIAGFVAGAIIRKAYTRHVWKAKVASSSQHVLDTALICFASIGLFFLPLAYLVTDWLSFADYTMPDWAGWTGGGVFAVSL